MTYRVGDRELFGVTAMFDSADELVCAARRLRGKGYRRLDAYTPFPVEGLSEALGCRSGKVRWCVLAGALLGGALAYFLQWYSAVVDYPVNVGGRPLHAWPAFLVVTFEMAVLGGALAGFFGMLALSGLPRLHHPVFDLPEFGRATRGRFFLCIESSDERFDVERVTKDLEALAPLTVQEVPR
ncbi:MAG TPA: DUF3341 domain-containing protein [Woeseiaceae bacterium]|nr:DUF3341 domain-containing protein [Woeseiaceae bacterium]